MASAKPTRRLRALALAALLVGGAASSVADPVVTIDLAERHAAEVKALLPLLRAAVKDDLRRQAWYLAWRITIADPRHAEALAVLSRWRDDEVLKGNPPAKTWVAKRDAVLRTEGDAYTVEARKWMSEGVKAADCVALTERSIAYGTKVPDVLAALDAAGYGWAGTFGTLDKEAIDAGLGTLRREITFPHEWDDGFVYAKMFWPDARILRLGQATVIAGDGFLAACRRVAVLWAMDAAIQSLLGSVAKDPKEDDPPIDILVVPDAATYDRLGASLTWDDVARAKLTKSSTWFAPWHHKALALAKDRTNPWMGDDAPFLHAAAAVLIRRHLGGSGTLSGRGTWILEGLAGAFEAFVPKGRDDGEIDPSKCPRLAAARALRDDKRLLPWDRLFDTDGQAADQVGRVDLRVKFRGSDREAKDLDVVSCQATAFVIGLLRADEGKHARKVGTLLIEASKRDRLPDVDKAMGWPKGRAVKEAERILDSVSGE